MSHRITVVLSDDILRYLRNKQAKLIKTSTNSVSFSAVLNAAVKDSMKK